MSSFTIGSPLRLALIAQRGNLGRSPLESSKAKLDFSLKFPARMAAWSCLAQPKDLKPERENMTEQNVRKLYLILFHENIQELLSKEALEAKLPTIDVCTDEKRRWEESEKRRERVRREKIRVRAGKGGRVAKHCAFPFNALCLQRVEK